MLIDEIDEMEEMTGSPPGDESPSEPAGGEAGNETTELERLLVQKDEELIKINDRFREMEAVISGKDEELSALKKRSAEVEERLALVNDSLTAAVSSYRESVIRANPEIVEELISGDTVESINESLDRAQNLVSKVRQGLETEISLTRVPAGAPERTSPDPSTLSPREKIQYAIGNSR